MNKRGILLVVLALLSVGVSWAQHIDTKASSAQDNAIFTVVEHAPEFPGGSDALFQYLGSHAHYPEQAKQQGIQGTVYLTFIIERDGSISNTKILSSPSDLLSTEAIRLVNSMPKWKPGKQRDKKVRVQYTLPINFQLD